MSPDGEGARADARRGWLGTRWRKLLALYAVLLVASLAARALRGETYEVGVHGREVLLADPVAVAARDTRSASLRIVWDEFGDPLAPPLVLLHGNPGGRGDFRNVAEDLGRDFRVLVPDLPGFGDSTRDLGSAPRAWSSANQARRLLAWLDTRGVDSAHFLGFSASGAVALQVAEQAPERVRSLTLLAAIGVQELELFGNYELNHAVHGLQLVAIEALGVGLPHFGALDDFPLDRSYARWFYDTDQRPLRGVLESLEVPVLIVNGEEDFLVPPEAAREHHRIVPQSELWTGIPDHFALFRPDEAAALAERVAEFVQAVEAGAATTRAEADPARVAAAAVPFDPASVPPAEGFTLVVLMLLIAVATWVTEDLTCIAAGVLVAQGRIEYTPAVVACVFGIFTGDLQLYFAGRWIGRPALLHRPLRWFLTPDRVDRATQWFAARGIRAIFASRFLPGLRLPTYFAAGMLHTSFWFFAGFFLLAATLWTPILVGASAWLGGTLEDSMALFERYTLPAVVALVLFIYATQRLLLPLFSHRGRRLLVGSWRRKRRWEFWPPWVFYPPVVLYVLWLAVKHRSLLVLTCVNPGIPTGGFLGESKEQILAALDGVPETRLARLVLPAREAAGARRARVAAFRQANGLALPLVLKPDVGQRGEGVRILRSEEQLESALEGLERDSLLQEFAGGPEFGLFWVQRPPTADGHDVPGEIISITEKRSPVLVGDGVRTLEQLILDDERAVCLAQTYFALHTDRLFEVLPAGAEFPLVELGTHCRGALFLDGGEYDTPELREVLARLSAGFEGFAFGRYDVRVPSVEDLRAGRGLKVLELNGLTSEATHIYDPAGGLRDAYRTLFTQWRTAYEIGTANHARGASKASWRELAAVLADFAFRTK